ncbi:MAG TPA: hypothetical protein VGX92_13095 [Pyrinomonadaceae bacterium]|jgi:hypothetical protein|nr:hypothetical protein [Pyrinomonadaceae bacterium]
MKRCPRCNRTFWNDEYTFCLDDGTLLSAAYDPKQTIVLPTPNKTDLPPTEVSAPTLKLDEVKTDREIVATPSSGKRRRWNDISFFEEAVKKLKIDEVGKLRWLYEFSTKCADRIKWGTGPQRGTFNVVFDVLSPSKSLYTVYSDGNIDLNFSWLPDDEKTVMIINKFAQSLKKLKGFDISNDFKRKFIRVRKQYWMTQIDDFMRAILEVAELPSHDGF